MTKRKASTALDNVTESSDGAHDNNGGSVSALIHSNSSIIRHNGISSVDEGQHVSSNNQNDNSNSNSNSSSNNIINNGGNQQKSKKERADNWSSAEIQVLHRGIESRRDIFYGPPSQATKKNRELAWEAITKEVNSVSTTPRTLSQVMKKFKNEKCRAKRKFIDSEKDGHTNLGSNVSNFDNNGSTSNGLTATNTGDVISNLGAHGNSDQQHQLSSQSQQAHHMTTSDQMQTSQPAINVVKLTPQNVAKTMIDLPGHVQQIQMPNDDMVLIVPPEMDGLLSGMNIVSDGNGQNHLQKCSGNSTLQGHSHNHHNQHAIQTLNTTQTLSNGQMTNGMMARTIPTASMCSLVYSTGGEVCAGSEQHISANVVTQNTLSATNHIGVHAQNLMHHRVSIEQNQVQHQHQQHHHQQQQQQQHHHQMHQQQQHQQQPHQQQQPQPQPQQHPHNSQHQAQHLAPHQQQPHHLSTTATLTNTGGVAVESQLKNLLINLLFKEGQNASHPITNQSQNYAKQKNDILTTIASSLSKIESHLDKLTKIAGPFIAQNINVNATDAASVISSAQLGDTNSSLNTSDRNNNSVNASGPGNNLSNHRGAEE